jgi:hypothetical protein
LGIVKKLLVLIQKGTVSLDMHLQNHPFTLAAARVEKRSMPIPRPATVQNTGATETTLSLKIPANA